LRSYSQRHEKVAEFGSIASIQLQILQKLAKKVFGSRRGGVVSNCVGRRN
jgi:hypothetical protein